MTIASAAASSVEIYFLSSLASSVLGNPYSSYYINLTPGAAFSFCIYASSLPMSYPVVSICSVTLVLVICSLANCSKNASCSISASSSESYISYDESSDISSPSFWSSANLTRLTSSPRLTLLSRICFYLSLALSAAASMGSRSGASSSSLSLIPRSRFGNVAIIAFCSSVS
jgi:hypothetical protein